MKKAPYEFTSVLAGEMEAYIRLRESQGHQSKKDHHYLAALDQYLQDNSVAEKNLSVEITEGWLKNLPDTMNVNTKIVIISHYSQFANYLHTLKIPAFIPERPCGNKLYAPYIFTQAEVEKMIVAVDNRAFEKKGDKTPPLQFPLILRMLYGCGLRLDEVLLLRTGNVDLEAGVLKIHGGKGNKYRLVPMDMSLTEICRQYFATAGKSAGVDALLFENGKGERRSQTWARSWFNYALAKANIQKPDLPRHSRNICLHCLRHTFAVESFRKRDQAGINLYAAAPLLSTYMGHHDMNGTEQYLHMTAETSKDILSKTQDYMVGLFPEVPQ